LRKIAKTRALGAKLILSFDPGSDGPQGQLQKMLSEEMLEIMLTRIGFDVSIAGKDRGPAADDGTGSH